MKKKESSLIDKVSGVLPYVGFVIVVALIVHTQYSARIIEQTIEQSVAKQESLRNILWTNLLAQRIAVFSTSSILQKDTELIDRAKESALAAPTFLIDQQTPRQREMISQMSAIAESIDPAFVSLQSTLPLATNHPVLDLLKKIDILGSALNEHESEEWFNLVEKNALLISDLKGRQIYIYATYVIFVFFLVVLWLVGRLRIRAEKSLRENERKLRVLTEASFEGLIIIEGDSKIIEVNPAFESLLGYSSASVVQKSLANFITSTVEGFELDVNSIAMSHISTSEGIGICKDGRRIPIEISVKNSLMANVAIKIIAVRDLTEKKITEHLRVEKESAEQSNRAKSLFLANMSHELRTPMHGILSFARFGLVKTTGPEQAEVRDFFNEILGSGNRLMQLLDDLLDLAKLEAGKMSYAMQALDFLIMCEKVIDELKAFANERSITFKFIKHEAKHIILVMDDTRIAQVIRNILTNAIKFSSVGGLITIDAKVEESNLICKISNAGIHIPHNELESIFDKFSQSTKTRTGAGGTGLGLSICKEIVNHHHGKIYAESEQGGLTSFIFSLPLEQPKFKKNLKETI